MVDDHIIDSFDPKFEQVRYQLELLCRVNRIDECSLLAPLDQVGIVARTVREGDKGIEETPVKIKRTDPEDSRCYFT